MDAHNKLRGVCCGGTGHFVTTVRSKTENQGAKNTVPLDHWELVAILLYSEVSVY